MSTFNLTYYHRIIQKTHIHDSSNLYPKFASLSSKKPLYFPRKKLLNFSPVSTMASSMKEVLPPALDSASEPPRIFDGTSKLYISYSCPYAQRVWITRNYKELQDVIQLVPIDLKNRPAWYKEKVYPENKVPALEHNNEVKGESLDLIRYIDSSFKGPSLYPDDPNKKEFGEEMLSFTSSFYKSVVTCIKENDLDQAGTAFDDIEKALSKFYDGPFFLGEFSLVDIAYIPFVERFQAFLSQVMIFDITKGRTKLGIWVEEMNKIDAYTQTKRDPKEYVESYKKRFLSSSL